MLVMNNFTKNQHYIPRVYLKEWETDVTTIQQPSIKFNGVFTFKKQDIDSLTYGDGRKTMSIVNIRKLYTVDYSKEAKQEKS